MRQWRSVRILPASRKAMRFDSAAVFSFTKTANAAHDFSLALQQSSVAQAWDTSLNPLRHGEGESPIGHKRLVWSMPPRATYSPEMQFVTAPVA
jgi:hypothetical protein